MYLHKVARSSVMIKVICLCFCLLHPSVLSSRGLVLDFQVYVGRSVSSCEDLHL